MDIFGIGGSELLVILIVAGLILGPERLARVGREAGKFVRNAKAYFNSLSGELKSELDLLDEVRAVKGEVDKTVGDISLKNPPRS
ncbi:MAG: twin-arginine translocase TatA/TatE family subunit [Chloroflexi bacterium]|nr:twin-arginine translocase TatA/TatE family subunit [Chloroflexota bacterium]